MKRFVLAGLFAIGLIALSQQQASAWVNSRFSVGLNWGFQSGGNQLLWGAWRNGQPPGPEAFGGYQGGHGHAMPQYAPMPHAHSYAPMPQQMSPSMPAAQSNYAAAPTYYSSPYQFANYTRPVYYYYYYPSYSYPSYYYYYGQ